MDFLVFCYKYLILFGDILEMFRVLHELCIDAGIPALRFLKTVWVLALVS